ncbi:PREDICTED: uncharacterized protein LOC104699575 [Camelina sativa]|uniref:Uncharacterized protein LOC104699575 n=1 Tax=Camelina sativa TaxID=90675 RepID=A0ABM0SLZ1_CAMSA|nr:PREDICTED: uncharacterized protein LOC104699575 [Camelina sativa]
MFLFHELNGLIRVVGSRGLDFFVVVVYSLVDLVFDAVEEAEDRNQTSHWKPPPPGWLKCNLGISRGQRNMISGAAWVLRDEFGRVLIHSRKAHMGFLVKDEADMHGFLWSVQSMISHKVTKIIFAFESDALVGVILRPKAWPSFAHQQAEMLLQLATIQDWRVQLEKPSENRRASLIAQSVPDYALLQSYVATGFPLWLHELFEHERLSSSF